VFAVRSILSGATQKIVEAFALIVPKMYVSMLEDQATYAADCKRLRLSGSCNFTDKLLPHLIGRLPSNEQPRFLSAWNQEIQQQLASVIARIQEINLPTDDLWKSLAAVGLTGESLDLKRHLLVSSAEGGLRKRFLKILNSWLGSLAEVIPGAHPVKELKELLEDFFGEDPEPDTGLTNLFKAGGFVSFGLPV
jgi:hypothetical protein